MDSPHGPELRLAGLSVPFCVDDGGVISARVPEVSNMRLVGYNDLQAPPPAINFDAIAGRALPAMPRRSTHRSGCACEGGVRGDRVRGDYHPVQTA